MKRDSQGRYVTISTVREKANAFVPAPLPPHPPIDWTPDLRSKFDQALLALGRLDSVSTLLPDTSLFLYMYVRKEAVLSSMIEGTQSSLSDLLLFELEQEPGVPLDDVREVSNYVAALDHGLRLLEEGLPLSLRLLREIHGVLLSKGRGSSQTPGEFRRSQNWIGGTRPGNATFVPPPADAVMECMSKLELFLHDQPEPTPVLLKAAFAHVQFETIHPFLDGNGRLGRLLITLLLCSESVLREPLLYLSLYFKAHRQHYYELLNRVRQTGDWEAWLAFFAEAVIVTATQAVETAQQLLALTSQDRDKISMLGRAAASSLRVHRALMAHPIATSGSLVEETSLTPATVNKALGHLEQLGIVKELTAQKRNRLFSYARYIEIISRGTEPPGRSG
ncbi:Fic family protein [Halochromatium roseum]|uniref:Fic family protein n=1 Tax=Halochromatium roseum TaxID=391920 RepID=UPI001914580F|nr:Fic family protein [Halochromatium roseum]MBK5939265.1 cell filamentation protein Fic [Halochromatium roseum]